MYIDLQLHSTYSDGALSPSQLATWLASKKVRVAALTDHNTVAGIDQFFKACRKKKIKPIAGMEIYARYGARKLNLLYYNFDQSNGDFHEFLRKTQVQRCRNITRALEYWQEQGLKSDIKEVLAKHNHYIPVNGMVKHIKKYPENREKIQKDLKIKNPAEWQIIKYYFKNREKYYLSETYIDIHRLDRLRKKIGGQIIIGHPGKNRIKSETILRILDKKLVDGLEILSPHHSWDKISHILHILKQNKKKVIMTGGSDFHGFDRNSFKKIKCSWDYFKIDKKLLPGVEEIINF